MPVIKVMEEVELSKDLSRKGLDGWRITSST